MASLDVPRLVFDGGCPDCGRREVSLPQPLPRVGDDFDWRTRDFDGFRLHMLEDLAARFPERARWTRADLEVVLIEALAAALDQLSDMTDRVFAEGYLETARRPDSVHRLLRMIGFDASAAYADATGSADAEARQRALFEAWQRDPHKMELDRREGRRRIREQQRMVHLEDFRARLEEHPLVVRAAATRAWSGSFWLVRAAVSLFEDIVLDAALGEQLDAAELGRLAAEMEAFHRARQLAFGVRVGDESLEQALARHTPRALLRPFIDAYRMLGQPVELQGAVPVGIQMRISLRVQRDYFNSEIERAVRAALGRGPGQFFEPGRLKFGESLLASDLYQTLAGIEGVVDVTLTEFKRVGARFADQSSSGEIVLSGLEIARCDNDPEHPELGSYRLSLQGGRGG